jgi:hypothetical protein
MGLVLWGMSFGAVKKTLATVALAMAYSMILVGFALGTETWWPVWAFWGLTFNRLTTALVSPMALIDRKGVRQARRRATNEWVTSAMLYLLWLFATIPPWVPALGITPEVVAAAGIPGAGPWAEEPQRVLVTGAGYFLCQAWVHLSGKAPITVSDS